MLRYDADARYSLTVTILRGHVKGGVIVVDEPTGLPEGTAVELVLLTDEDELSADDRATASDLREGKATPPTKSCAASARTDAGSHHSGR